MAKIGYVAYAKDSKQMREKYCNIFIIDYLQKYCKYWQIFILFFWQWVKPNRVHDYL